MTNAQEPGFPGLLARLREALQTPVDFRPSDAASTGAAVHLLAVVATYFNVAAVGEFGGRLSVVRAPGLIEQIVGAAFQTFDGSDLYPSEFDKAAMLLRGIGVGHPFNDGNKRTAFFVTAYYLDRVGHPLPTVLAVDDVVSLCLRVSGGELRAIRAIAEELQRLWQHDALG